MKRKTCLQSGGAVLQVVNSCTVCLKREMWRSWKQRFGEPVLPEVNCRAVLLE
jgi:hypothetical protein